MADANIGDFDWRSVSPGHFELARAAPEPNPPPKVATTAYRDAQEALSNSAKYAQASLVQVTLAEASQLMPPARSSSPIDMRP